MSQDRNSSPQLPLRPGLITLVVGLAFAVAMLITPWGFGQEGDKTKDKSGDKKDADAKKDKKDGADKKEKAKVKVTPKQAKEFIEFKSMRVYFKSGGLDAVEKHLVGLKLKIESLAGFDRYFTVDVPKGLRKDDVKILEELANLLTQIKQNENVADVTPDRPIVIEFGRRHHYVQVEPCPICPPTGCRPNDPLLFRQWDMENLRAPKAWCAVRTSPVVVAVIDSGVDFNHPDLRDNIWENPNPGFYLTDKQIDEEISTVRFALDDGQLAALKTIFKGFSLYQGKPEKYSKFGVSLETKKVKLEGKPYTVFAPVPAENPQPYDFKNAKHSHGTQVAGIIGAVGNNGIGISGVCANVKIMPVKVFHKINEKDRPDGDHFAIVAGMIYAKLHGAKVINLSLGRFNGKLEESERWALSYLDQAGVLVVTAAGNGKNDGTPGVNTDNIPHLPAAYPHPNIISVANLTQGEVLATTSNFARRTVHIAAPGDGSITTYPRGKGEIKKDYGEFTGTSAAAPHVAGAAALLWGHPKYAAMNHHAIKAQLLDNARLLNSLKGKCRTEGTLDLSFMCREGCQDVYPFHTGPFAPAPMTPKMAGMAMAPGTLKLTVPANAKVFLDDRQTTSSGVERVFTTPPLTKGYTYSYELRVEVDHDGTTLRNVRSIQIQGGESTAVTLDLPTLKSLAQRGTK